LFGRSAAYLSSIFNDFVIYISRRYHDILQFHPRLRNYERLRAFGAAVGRRSQYGGDLIWGFIDGTFRPFCRPGQDQHLHYTGHKRRHGLRFQAICTPDGLISSLDGPWLARYNDWRIYNESQLTERFREVRSVPSFAADTNSLQIYNGRDTLFIYGDPAYHHAYGVVPTRRITRAEQELNAAMSRCRISVENGFGKVSSLWRTGQFAANLQSRNSPVAAYYVVAVLLTNIYTCLRGKRTSFDLWPPDLDEYLEV
jgi:hypothetical protein